MPDYVQVVFWWWDPGVYISLTTLSAIQNLLTDILTQNRIKLEVQEKKEILKWES